MKEFKTRLLSSIVYSVLIISSVFISSLSYLVVMFFLCLLTITEYQKFNKIRNIFSVLLLFTLIILMYFNLINNWIFNLILIISIISNIILAILILLNKLDLNVFKKHFLLVSYLTLSSFFILKIPFNDSIFFEKKILFFLLIIWSNDTFAYIFGKFFGKTFLNQKISPKKTWEGLFFGIFISLIMSYLANIFYFQYDIFFVIIATICICITGILGDLTQSFFKRSANVKNSGKIIPGHGGIFDRMDSMIFSAPFFYLIIN
tara:strand:- start:86618 stop:87400 length:783 start_codon:yes stop_codon:yes gene_type:complete